MGGSDYRVIPDTDNVYSELAEEMRYGVRGERETRRIKAHHWAKERYIKNNLCLLSY